MLHRAQPQYSTGEEEKHKNKIQMIKIIKYEAISLGKRGNRGELRGGRTVGLLNTHTRSKHTNTTSVFSFPTNMSLETIMAVRVLLIGLMNHSQTDENHNYS